MCARFEALEKNTSQLASDLMSLKEELKTLGGDLAAVKVQVENKVDEIKDSHFEKKINESQNRSRRHNMVFWNQFQCKEQWTWYAYMQGLSNGAPEVTWS